MIRRYYKAILISVISIIILLYALNIIYLNKTHNIFILANPVYNNELLKYDSLTRLFSDLFIISIHMLAIPIYCLYKKNISKGLLYLNIITVAVLFLCISLDIVLDNFSFKVASKVVESLLLLLSISILYLIMSLFGVFRNRKKNIQLG